MTIELTPGETKTLLFYLDKAKIDAERIDPEGMAAVFGFKQDTMAVKDIKSIINKIHKGE